MVKSMIAIAAKIPGPIVRRHIFGDAQTAPSCLEDTVLELDNGHTSFTYSIVPISERRRKDTK